MDESNYQVGVVKAATQHKNEEKQILRALNYENIKAGGCKHCSSVFSLFLLMKATLYFLLSILVLSLWIVDNVHNGG